MDLPSAISRYQDVLQYAGSEVNFVFGIGLYMAPSDMLLRVSRVEAYNNEIVIATSDQVLGLNSGINLPAAPHNSHGDTGEVGLVKSKSQLPVAPSNAADKASPRDKPTVTQKASADQHADEKTALMGGVAVGLLTIWLLR